MATSELSVVLPDQLLDELDKIAKAARRDRAWIVQHVLQQFLAGEGQEILEDAEGLAQLERGESYDLDEVLDEAEERIRQALERRKAG